MVGNPRTKACVRAGMCSSMHAGRSQNLRVVDECEACVRYWPSSRSRAGKARAPFATRCLDAADEVPNANGILDSDLSGRQLEFRIDGSSFEARSWKSQPATNESFKANSKTLIGHEILSEASKHQPPRRFPRTHAPSYSPIFLMHASTEKRKNPMACRIEMLCPSAPLIPRKPHGGAPTSSPLVRMTRRVEKPAPKRRRPMGKAGEKPPASISPSIPSPFHHTPRSPLLAWTPFSPSPHSRLRRTVRGEVALATAGLENGLVHVRDKHGVHALERSERTRSPDVAASERALLARPVRTLRGGKGPEGRARGGRTTSTVYLEHLEARSCVTQLRTLRAPFRASPDR